MHFTLFDKTPFSNRYSEILFLISTFLNDSFLILNSFFSCFLNSTFYCRISWTTIYCVLLICFHDDPWGFINSRSVILFLYNFLCAAFLSISLMEIGSIKGTIEEQLIAASENGDFNKVKQILETDGININYNVIWK